MKILVIDELGDINQPLINKLRSIGYEVYLL